MKNIIETLSNSGYSTSQISQLLKIRDIGVDIEDAIQYADVLTVKHIDEYRFLKDMLSAKTYTKSNLQEIFLAFCNNINIKILDGKCMSVEQDMLIIRNMMSQNKCNLGLDLSPACNASFSIKFMQDIIQDIENGIDVNIYLNSTLSEEKKEVLRHGLKKGIDLSEALSLFSFLNENDIEYMHAILENDYDYKEVLKKIKNTEKTLLILEKKDYYGIDMLPYVNAKMSIDVLEEIAKRIQNGEDLKAIRNMPISDVNTIDLLLQIKSTYYPLKYCKNVSADRLKLILDAIKINIPTERINELLEFPNLGLIQASIECLRYNREDIVDFFKKNSTELMFRRYSYGVIALLKYNDTHKEQYDIIKFIQGRDNCWTNEPLFSYLTECIMDDTIDYDICNYILNSKYTSEQAIIVNKAHKQGCDVKTLFDPRLSCKQLNAIITCIELGLEVNKIKEYHFSSTEEKDLVIKRQRVWGEEIWTDFDSKIYIYEDVKRGYIYKEYGS